MSKELEALEALKFLVDNYGNFEFDFNIIETALKQLESIQEDYCVCEKDAIKKLRALEIIKEKRVNCFLLIAIMRTSNRLEHYNQNYGKNWQLTQEEYDLLKEVLL